MAGGTLAILAKQGAAVYFLSATRGEGGETGEPPLCEIERLGQVRTGEIRCAVEALGGAGLNFLDYIDPRVGPDNALFAYTEDVERVAEQVRQEIIRLRIDAVFAHGSNGEYGHPAHQLTHRAVRRAIEILGERAPLFYSPHAAYPENPRPRLMNKDDPADLVIDITAVLPQKIAAAECHRTQHALFVRNASKDAGRPLTVPEVILPVESLRRQYPPVPEGKPVRDAVADALRAAGAVIAR